MNKDELLKEEERRLRKELRTLLGKDSVHDYARVEPFRNPRPPSGRVKKVPSTLEEAVEALPPEQKKRVKKVLDGKTFAGIYSTALGLPSRVRRFVRKTWKLIDSGADWEDVASNTAEQARKILEHRLDVVMLLGFVARKEGRKVSDEQIMKIVGAVGEADALLTVYAHLFLPGVTAKIANQCLMVVDCGNKYELIGGLADVMDYGVFDRNRRSMRVKECLETIKKNEWKLPERQK